MSKPIPDFLHTGSRIQIDSYRATIKYIGPILGTKGEWLGIEWDDPTRGKHNGVHQGTQYFECRFPTSGSFIRFQPDKVKTGVTFLSAFRDKYFDDEMDKTDDNEDYSKTSWDGKKQVMVETYGFNKIQRNQRKLNTLTVVGLAEQYISSAGYPDEISNEHLIIEDLDLSRNLLSDWNTISTIIAQLPHLRIIRLNHLRIGAHPLKGLCFTHISTMALNQSLITWEDIEALTPSLPQLKDLQLGGNGITKLSSITLDNLECLNLEMNDISDWKEVGKLRSLPKLRTLYLNDNKLTSVQSPPTNDSFMNLQYLRIENNQVDSLSSIDALNHYPKLTKLRCRDNPVFKDMKKEVQSAQVLGRIKNITILNGISISPKERVDLERYYLANCTKEGKTHQEIASKNPRYPELCKEHGEPNLQVNSKETSAALKDRLITITITIRNNINADDLLKIKLRQQLPPPEDKVTKRILPTMTIRNVKHLIQRLLKIPANKQQLYLIQGIDHEDQDVMIMDICDDLRDIKFYDIHDEDEITII
ncbi:hypothetical protein BDB01DRAFT_786539 [Pilobolus umbonatus]|nr:hypothetical protein BDB01DRAFT_786539 [Pilobolus umbonatus]